MTVPMMPAVMPRLVRLVASLLLAAAWAVAGRPAGAAAQPAPPPERMKLVYGSPVTPPSMVHLPPCVAQAKGFFDEVGLDVEINSFEGDAGALRGGIADGPDVVGTSADPMFAAIQQGASIRAIGTCAPKLSGVITTRSDIRTARDLKGREIGIQEVGGFNEVMARLLPQGIGLTPRDVQYVSVATAGRVPALVNGQIGASTLHIDSAMPPSASSPTS